MLVKRKLDPKLKWFGEARFGMFVHFGLYALLERGEWVQYNEGIRRENYAPLARRFNPRRFDAEEWVATAQRAGARYITVTAKHHDGFCLFDSALTDYKTTNTPFRRDLIGELIAACQRVGMRIVLYYSQPDWHHSNFLHRKGMFKDIQYDRPDDEPNWPRYLEYVFGQVRELCTNYGRIDGIWFDGVQKTEREWRGRELYRMIRALQPGAVVNERAGFGDFFTPERRLAVAAAAEGYMVEACQSVCAEDWGYHRDGTLFSSTELLENLVRMAAAGGNYLLNIGPKPDGSLPEDQVQRLTDIGDWLKQHGEAIYGTGGCPRHQTEEVLLTQRGRRLFAHLLRWPTTEALALDMLRTPPTRARLLATGARLRVEVVKGVPRLRGLPSMPPHPGVNVVELTFDTERGLRSGLEARPTKPEAPPVTPVTSGTVTLAAEAAVTEGFGAKGTPMVVREVREAEVRVRRPAESCLDQWFSPEQTATWVIEAERPLRCDVAVEMACAAPYEGSTFTVEIGKQRLRGTVPATGGFNVFRSVKLGTVEIPAGRTRATVRPEKLNIGYAFARVKGIRLREA